MRVWQKMTGTLPEADSVPCDSATSKDCDAGYFLPAGGADAECEQCSAGSFSLGNGTAYYSFE